MNGMSPQLQNQVAQFQQVQQQIQAVATQKAQMDAQLKELRRTVEELAKTTGAVYRNVGALLVQVDDVPALKAELEESVETMEIRMTGLERQEKSLREMYENLQNAISAAMGQTPAAPSKRKDEDDEDEDE